MYMGYDVKGGIRYAKLCSSERIDGKVKTTQKSLGRVLDEEKRIYQNRERGVFTYDIATGEYGKPDPADIPSVKRWNHRESLILDFGDAYFIDNAIERFGLYRAVDAMDYGNNDSVRALLLFYIISQAANCYAQDWYDGSYARILFPKANLESQRISDILSAIGDEWSYREFFREYLPLVVNAGKDAGEEVLIDSTGLPNSIRFPLTAVSNHNGEISNEVRLIYVVQKKTDLPLFFRYIPGNVVDVSTLTKTIKELRSYNIDTKFATLDAGYLTDENMRELFEGKVSFVSRLKENRKIYKTVAECESHDLEQKCNLVEYNSRYVYIKRVRVEVLKPNADDRILGPDESPDDDAHAAYVYLCRDLLMKGLESGKLFSSAKNKRLSTEDVHERLESQGVFMLISSRPIKKEDVLSIYYMRQQIEQVFDLCKNNTKMLPLRVQSEETFRGHLLLSFAASVIVKHLQEMVKKTTMTPQGILIALRNHKCKVFDNNILTMEAAKKANDVYKLFKITVPHEIPKKTGCN
jgi:hypothetical protein